MCAFSTGVETHVECLLGASIDVINYILQSGGSIAGIVGSNPAGGMDVSVVCCQVAVSASG